MKVADIAHFSRPRGTRARSRAPEVSPADSPTTPARVRSFTSLRAAVTACRRCSLYKTATQAVPGAGPGSSRIMLVGEAPGDSEDIQGRPFVGPAGVMLDRALHDAGLERRSVYVTNAVKHFKFEPRGKRRLHLRPGTTEIQACKWWLEEELRLVAPEGVVALGATAARALLGKTVTITAVRGRPLQLGESTQLLVTIHPSYLLRMTDREDQRAEYRRFVADLSTAARWVATH